MYRLHFPIKGLAVYMLINFSIIAINYTTCLRSIKIFVSAVTMPRTLLSTVSVGHQTYDEKTRFLCKYKKMIILYITLCTFNLYFVNKKHNKNQASLQTWTWDCIMKTYCASKSEKETLFTYLKLHHVLISCISVNKYTMKTDQWSPLEWIEGVFLALCKVSETPFEFQGD